jgi:cell division cycle 14
MTTFIHPVIGEQVFLAQSVHEIRFADSFRIFRPTHAFQYRAVADDFGPLNLSCIVDFIRALDQELADHPDSKITLCIDEGRRLLTNAVFLLGAYMILKLNMSPQDVCKRFSWLDPHRLAPYRDASFQRPDFSLRLIDCWKALARGKELEWFAYSAEGYMWGDYDVDEYRHYDDPANGDVHELIPGELIALPSPKDIAGGADFRDDADGRRAFSPSYIALMLLDMGVSTLVRLGAARYNAAAMAARGIQVVDIACPDDGRPPDAAVAAFVQALNAAPRAVAVHCGTGRGQTGALAALHLMRSHGFMAREAMGWLRMVRGGSVVGEQQHFLCDVGAALDRLLVRSICRRGVGPAFSGLAGAAGQARDRSGGLTPILEHGTGSESDAEDGGGAGMV